MVSRKHAGTSRPRQRGRNVNADKPLYCSGCGKQQSEVESLIAMAGAVFVCNECVELLHGIEQRRKTGDPIPPKKREVKLEELQRIHADILRLRDDINHRLDWIENEIKHISKGFEP